MFIKFNKNSVSIIIYLRSFSILRKIIFTIKLFSSLSFSNSEPFASFIHIFCSTNPPLDYSTKFTFSDLSPATLPSSLNERVVRSSNQLSPKNVNKLVNFTFILANSAFYNFLFFLLNLFNFFLLL